jgi:serine/threonine-protein kinase
VVGAERFLAEIETTANLQHPHILPLFDSGEADGFLFYVMPYIEGETLRDRIDREKQLPVEEAVGIATAVASALAVAHEQGVIHRDVKPSNILLSRGEPLVTDFGIAIAVTKSSGARLTETGLSVGTPYYMSPEQATGDREITAASDVYALGCVLYEMLVGEPPYVGATAQAVLGKILTEKPRHPSAVRAVVPANVEGAVLRALEKLPADRFKSASGFVRAITDASFRYGESAGAAAVDPATIRRWKRLAHGAVAASFVLLGASLWGFLGRGTPAASPVVLALELGDLEVIGDVKVSPDGSTFAVAASEPGEPSLIWIRRVDEADFRPLPGTESATHADFSPNGAWVVYRDRDRDALVKVPVAGGGPVVVLDAPDINPVLPSWGPAGDIGFRDPARGAYLVSENGASGARLVLADGAIHDFLPEGRGVLGTLQGRVFVMDLDTDSLVTLLPGQSPRYLRTGHVLYRVDGIGTFVVAFDTDEMRVVGEPVPIRDDVQAGFLSAGYDVSEGGTLVFRRGTSSRSAATDRIFVFADRTGALDTVPLPPRDIDNPKISPNGRWVVFGTASRTGKQLQLLDLVTGSSPELTTGTDRKFDPAWSPDGEKVLYGAGGDADGLYVIKADRSEPARLLLPNDGVSLYPGAWGADGMAIVNARRGSNSNLWTLNPDSAAEPRVYLDADYSEHWPIFSPDGAQVAFESSETGLVEVYVRDYPVPTGKWRISEGGGSGARWSPSGDELYFWRESASGVDSLFAVPIRRDPDFDPGDPQFLFSLRRRMSRSAGDQDDWDVHPDGRFLIAIDDAAGADLGEGTGPLYLVILNWFEELKARIGGT